MIYWVLSIGVSVALLVITAAAKSGAPEMAYVHMGLAAAISAAFALVGLRETRSLAEAGGSATAVAASSAGSMAIIWVWGALGLLATYATGVLSWKEWWHFFLAFAGAGILSLVFARLLRNAAADGIENERLISAGRILSWVQLVGMIIICLGLLVDGKMVRFLVPRHGDWAANNIFFFGALALAFLSYFSLRLGKAQDGE